MVGCRRLADMQLGGTRGRGSTHGRTSNPCRDDYKTPGVAHPFFFLVFPGNSLFFFSVVRLVTPTQGLIPATSYPQARECAGQPSRTPNESEVLLLFFS